MKYVITDREYFDRSMRGKHHSMWQHRLEDAIHHTCEGEILFVADENGEVQELDLSPWFSIHCHGHNDPWDAAIERGTQRWIEAGRPDCRSYGDTALQSCRMAARGKLEDSLLQYISSRWPEVGRDE